ncbi:Uncharacterised protein [Mycobacteroides abscessus subsp. massiliense]|nr:Uncharacterised protein [Mycobacteroides abscessus subsp. massiliense]
MMFCASTAAYRISMSKLSEPGDCMASAICAIATLSSRSRASRSAATACSSAAWRSIDSIF